MSRACPAFVGFAANVPSHCAVSPPRYRVAFANAIGSARPPCTPACLIDADASLSQSQPFDFCNEIFKVRHTSTNSASAVLARCRGWPCSRCHARCALNAARLFLFWMQRRFELDASQRATRCLPRRSPSRGEPQRPESLCPHERHCSSGPAGHGIRVGRKNRAKVNAHDLATVRDPAELARRGPSSLAFSSTFCHQRCVRDGMEARSRACTRPHRWPRHSFRLPPREGRRLSEHLGCFSPLEPNGGRDRSLDLLGLATRQDLIVTQP
jgi:hypothetical protein